MRWQPKLNVDKRVPNFGRNNNAKLSASEPGQLKYMNRPGDHRNGKGLILGGGASPNETLLSTPQAKNESESLNTLL